MTNKLLYLLITAIIALQSCGVQEQEPVNAISNDKLFEDPLDADAAIIGAYAALLGKGYIGGRFTAFSDVPTKNIDANSNYTDFNLINHFLFYPENEALTWIWRDIYIGINRTNLIIEKLTPIQDPAIADRKSRILAEARFLRAFHYFNLTQIFGDVPLITKPFSSGNINDLKVKRESKEVIYTQIFEDLNIAENDLPISYANLQETKGRATKATAKALSCRIHLYRNEYKEAADKAAGILDNFNYSLTKDYNSLFKDQLTSEALWEVQFNSITRNDIVYYYLPGGLSGWYWLKPSEDIINSYQPGDKRRDATLSTHEGSFYANKYSRIKTGMDNIIVFRLAEIILTRAEALAQLNYPDQEALKLLNQIRTRAGLKELTFSDIPDQKTFIEIIWKERRLELAFEGHEWYDIIRTRRAATVLGLNDPKKLVFPIPQTERNRNSNLTQNEGY